MPFTRHPAIWGALATLCLIVCISFGERALKNHYERGSYGYYESTEVYLEDQYTLLLYLPHPDLMWTLRPDIRLTLHEEIRGFGVNGALPRVKYEWILQTDKAGYRTHGSDGQYAEIVCFGDSRTLGEALLSEETYPARLETKLRHRGHPKVVANVGMDGWSIFQGATLLRNSTAHPKMRYAVFCFGINDTDPAWGMTDAERVAGPTRRAFTSIQNQLYRSFVFLWASRAYLGLKARLGAQTAARPTLYPTGPRRVPVEEYGHVLEQIAAQCDARSITPIFLLLPQNPYFDWGPWRVDTGSTVFDIYDDVLLATASKVGTRVVDTRSTLVNQQDAFIDDMHLSATGAEWVATAVADAIEDLESNQNGLHAPE